MTETRVDYSTPVLSNQPQSDTFTETIVTRHDVEQAWDDQVKACDFYEFCTLGNNPNKERLEFAHERVEEATRYALELDDLYKDQYRRRVWQGSKWFVIPKYAEAQIRGSWYAVEVLHAICTQDEWFVQVHALPIDGWQPHPFGMSRFGMDALDTGSVPLENIRVNGVRLGVK